MNTERTGSLGGAGESLDPALVGLIAAVSNASYDVAAYDAEFERGECSAGDTDTARADRDIAKAALYDELRKRAAVTAALVEALECLLPGLILDLRYADPDDDRDAMQSRINTVTEALAKVPVPSSQEAK